MDKNPHLPGSADEFIEKNLNLARSVAWGFAKKIRRNDQIKFDTDDLISIAYLGLIKAYKGFDPTGFVGSYGGQIKFSTYAMPKIKGELQRHIRDLGNTIRKSRDGDVVPTDSLDTPIFEDDGVPITLGMRIPCENDDFDERVIIKDFLCQITPREQKVYKLRSLGLSQLEISKIVNLSQVQVSRIEVKLLKLAREYGGNDMGQGDKTRDEARANTNKMREEIVTLEQFEAIGSSAEVAKRFDVSLATAANHKTSLKNESVINDKEDLNKIEANIENEKDLTDIVEPEPPWKSDCSNAPVNGREIKNENKVPYECMHKVVKVRWIDGYTEEFDVVEARAGAYLLWIKLKNGDTRHIPLTQVRWFNGVA